MNTSRQFSELCEHRRTTKRDQIAAICSEINKIKETRVGHVTTAKPIPGSNPGGASNPNSTSRASERTGGAADRACRDQCRWRETLSITQISPPSVTT